MRDEYDDIEPFLDVKRTFPSDETIPSVPDLVIYNRVPKCGSTTMLQVLNHIQNENNFTVYNQIEPNLSVSP